MCMCIFFVVGKYNCWNELEEGLVDDNCNSVRIYIYQIMYIVFSAAEKYNCWNELEGLAREIHG